VLPYLQQAGLLPSSPPDEAGAKVAAIVQAAGDRIKVAGDIFDYADFFMPDDQLVYDEAAWAKRLAKPGGVRERLASFRDRLAAADAFDAGSLEQLMQDFVRDQGIAIGQIIHAVRIAVTGKPVGFGMFETLAILGHQSCLNRIDRALARLSTTAP
jgi:glutamyl-tRNA synthetase